MICKAHNALFFTLAYLLLAIGTGCYSENRDSQIKNEVVTAPFSGNQCIIDTRNDANNFQPQYLPYHVVRKHLREPAFTQGLQYNDGVLYESSGLRGKSFIAHRQFPSTSLKPGYEKRVDLAPEYFAEGLTLHKGRLHQLTWTAGEVFIYKPNSLSLIDKLKIQGEGWGISSDGTHLYTSNGSSTIAVRNDKLEQIDSIQAKIGIRPLKNLNELEWIDGCLFANIWRSPIIAIIDPNDGAVTAMIDGAPLLREQQKIYQAKADDTPTLDVLNGIAYRDDKGNLLVTGKNWSTIYEIELGSL